MLGLGGGPGTSPATLKGVIDAATAAAGGELPDGQALVATLHGPLVGRRAEAIRALFRDLDHDGVGLLAVPALRKRVNALEHPAVKAGGGSAEDALKSLLKPWRGREVVSEDDFLAVHVPVSALAPGDDAGFAKLARRLWRTAEQPTFNASAVGRSQRGVLQGGGGRGPAAPGPTPDIADWGPPPSVVVQARTSPQAEDRRRRDFEDRIRRSARARELLIRIRHIMQRKGRARALGGDELLNSLVYRFRSAAGINSKLDCSVGLDALRVALNQVGVGATSADVEDLLRAMDLDGTGQVDLEELLSVMRGPLRGRRTAIVRDVFDSLDRNGDGVLSLEEMQARYSPSNQPDVEAGRKDNDEAMAEFLLKLEDICRGDRLTLVEFQHFYEGVSAGIDSDQYFKHIVRTAWGLDSDMRCHGARNMHRDKDGHLQVTEGGICGPNDGW